MYSAICFRDAVKTVYLSDYVEKNLDRITKWQAGEGDYDWKPTVKVIARLVDCLSVEYDDDL